MPIAPNFRLSAGDCGKRIVRRNAPISGDANDRPILIRQILRRRPVSTVTDRNKEESVGTLDNAAAKMHAAAGARCQFKYICPPGQPVARFVQNGPCDRCAGAVGLTFCISEKNLAAFAKIARHHDIQ